MANNQTDVEVNTAQAVTPRVRPITDFPAAGRADATTAGHGWTALPHPDAALFCAALGVVFGILCFIGFLWLQRETRKTSQEVRNREGEAAKTRHPPPPMH